MTREEAIEFAKEQLEIFGKDSTMYEFLEWSITALEANNDCADAYSQGYSDGYRECEIDMAENER